MMPGTLTVRPRPMYSGTSRRLADSETTQLLERLFTPDPAARRADALREEQRMALDLALEERTSQRAERRQREIMDETQKTLERVQEAQENLLGASQRSLTTTLNRTFVLAGLALAGVAILNFAGKRSKKPGRGRSRKSAGRRVAFASPSPWRPS